MKNLLKSITLLVFLSIIISCAEPTYNVNGWEIETKTINKTLIIEHRTYEKEILTLSRKIVQLGVAYYSGGYKFDNDETIFKMNKELWLKIKKQANMYEYDELYDIQAQMQECWKKNKSVCNIN